MFTDAQSNSSQVDYEYDDHNSHDTHEGTRSMILGLIEAQPTHLKLPSFVIEVFIRLILVHPFLRRSSSG
jgi:hypothetical protein